MAAAPQRTAAQRTAALEHLVNEQLKSDLQQVLERRDALYERIAHCLELRNNMTMLLDEQLHSLKTKVNLGCDFYVDASIPDTSWVYVSVGLGFHAQMTLEEAVRFSSAREARLSAAADELTDRAARLKAKIKLVIGAIDEVQRGGAPT